jgi:hypothetical protein
MAGAICQGISADPQLFVNRLDLLGAYTMIEHLFIATDAQGRTAYTPTGSRHLELLREYAALVARLAQPLHADCAQFRPVAGTYSPYGVMYGYASNITEHMSVKVLQPEPVTRFSLEDVFTDGGADADRLAWISNWRRLPHISPDVQKLYEYPQQFAEEIFARIELALGQGATSTDAQPRTGRLFIVAEGDAAADASTSAIGALPVEYILSSDEQLVAAGSAQACDEARLLHRRREGEFLVSYRTPGGWVAITKDLLTAVLGAGHDARVCAPPAAAPVLALMCPGLVATACAGGGGGCGGD